MKTELNNNEIIYDSDLGDWIIDTDPGIDDTFAITLAMSVLGEHLKLISIQSGNVGVDKCVINAKKISVLNDFKVDICKGESYNISTFNVECFESIHGKDGFYDIEKYKNWENKYQGNFKTSNSAVEIIKLSKQYTEGKKLSILAIGPLTNLSLAYMLDPQIVNRFHRVVVMGGSYDSIGNVQPTGEFNFACDPIAAKLIFDKFKNIEVYCWEPSEKHRIFSSDVKFNKVSELASFSKTCLEIKTQGPENGVFADYGAAVSSFFPKSVTKKRFLYCDVIIDVEYDKSARFVVSETDIVERNREKCLVVDDLDLKFVHSTFNYAINK